MSPGAWIALGVVVGIIAIVVLLCHLARGLGSLRDDENDSKYPDKFLKGPSE